MPVAQHLHLDVARALDAASRGRRARRRTRRPPRARPRRGRRPARPRCATRAHALAAAAGGRLDQHGIAEARGAARDLGAVAGVRPRRRAPPARRPRDTVARAATLSPMAAIASGGGPMKVSPASIDRARERGVLGEEAVARDGWRRRPRARAACEERLDAQVGLARGRRADARPRRRRRATCGASRSASE